MLFLIFSVLCNVLLLVILKSFDRFKIPAIQGIVVNYFVAASVSFFFIKPPYGFSALIHADWFLLCIPLGALFISIFYLISLTSRKIGISVAAVSNKMSVIIPVIYALIYYHDDAGWKKITGLVLAMAAVYLTVKPRSVPGINSPGMSSISKILLTAAVFLGSGIIDTLVNYAQKTCLKNENETALFVAGSFYVAGIIGMLIIAYLVLSGKMKFTARSIAGGIVLGIPNYFSIYFIMLAIAGGQFQSSQVYPMVNMGVVLGSALSGVLVFREKLSGWNYAGIMISVIAIALIAGFL